MSIPKIIRALNYIDDDLISEADNYEPDVRKGLSKAGKMIISVAACVLIVLIIGILSAGVSKNEDKGKKRIIVDKGVTDSSFNKPISTPLVNTIAPDYGMDPGAMGVPIVYYEGKKYIYKGRLVRSIPKTAVYMSEVIDVGSSFEYISEHKNYEGTCSGYVYIDKNDDSVMFFEWKDWDEEIDGEKKFLILEGNNSAK